jgi:uncharacterized DUF497 family protein
VVAFEPIEDFIFTKHATQRLRDRGISLAWVERVLKEPEAVLTDRNDPTVLHRLRSIPEAGGRVLRVAYNCTGLPCKVITVFFDRKAKDPR